LNSNPDFLRVKGPDIVNGRDEIVQLRGFCLGGWMNMENFIAGYPGHESGLRAAIAQVLGEDKARFFFERFLHYFIAEDDLRYLHRLGCTHIRVPFNYRHFESDDRPFEYKPEGFALLDQVIGWARALGLYVILDLHAVQGWQNSGWHSDNSFRKALLWGQKQFEDRAVALWEELARRYRNEPFVAGYNVVNEPDAEPAQWLNHYYRRVTAAIRAIDPDHILFLEGNHYSQDFSEFDPPFDSNTVYSSHNYLEPGLNEVEYPGRIKETHYPGMVKDDYYDRARLENDYAKRVAFTLQHRVPNWVGEFGCISTGARIRPDHLRFLADMMEIIEGHGHHWAIWTYKDIGKMGLVVVDPESEWMRRTRPVREAKQMLRTDYWIERHPSKIDELLAQVGAHVEQVLGTGMTDTFRQHLAHELPAAVCEVALPNLLLPVFAEQFRGMSETEIDALMQSFAFQRCAPREELAQLIKTRAASPGK